MHEFELEDGGRGQKRESVKTPEDIARTFASNRAEKEANESLREKKYDAEAWKNAYWTFFEKAYYSKLIELTEK